MSIDKAIKEITKKLEGLPKIYESKNKKEQKEIADQREKEFRTTYQLGKTQWQRHHELKKLGKEEGEGNCTADKCVIGCRFFPDTGFLGKTIHNEMFFHYDDSNLDPSFYGVAEALKERRKIAAMTSKQLEKYRRVDQKNRFSEDIKLIS